jgi:hypothetical protein
MKDKLRVICLSFSSLGVWAFSLKLAEHKLMQLLFLFEQFQVSDIFNQDFSWELTHFYFI